MSSLGTPASSDSHLATVANGRAIDRAAVPELSLEEFQQAILAAVGRDQRVVALFGMLDPDPAIVPLYLVLADDQQSSLRLARTRVRGDRYPSLTPRCPQLHLFEREIAEQFGIRAEGHPWLKPSDTTAPTGPATTPGAEVKANP